MKSVKLFFLSMLLMGQLAGAPMLTPDAVARQYKEPLVRVFEYRVLLKGVHPFVMHLHTIATTKDEHFYVFDLNADQTQYRLKAHLPTKTPVPEGVRAAFPLHFYQGKAACIVTGEIFSTPMGYVTIFHEVMFLHQDETPEPTLKASLPQVQKAFENGPYMWELDYPFPYGEKSVEETYRRFMHALTIGDEEAIWLNRKALQSMLSPSDYQYMLWQERKQGFALFVENELRHNLAVSSKPLDLNEPFSRRWFCTGGQAYIKHLLYNHPLLNADFEIIFNKMENI